MHAGGNSSIFRSRDSPGIGTQNSFVEHWWLIFKQHKAVMFHWICICSSSIDNNKIWLCAGIWNGYHNIIPTQIEVQVTNTSERLRDSNILILCVCVCVCFCFCFFFFLILVSSHFLFILFLFYFNFITISVYFVSLINDKVILFFTGADQRRDTACPWNVTSQF